MEDRFTHFTSYALEDKRASWTLGSGDAEREIELDTWLHDYNFHRPHASLNLNTPASRSGLNRNNLVSLHS
jgi:transposase InsO family protein